MCCLPEVEIILKNFVCIVIGFNVRGKCRCTNLRVPLNVPGTQLPRFSERVLTIFVSRSDPIEFIQLARAKITFLPLHVDPMSTMNLPSAGRPLNPFNCASRKENQGISAG